MEIVNSMDTELERCKKLYSIIRDKISYTEEGCNKKCHFYGDRCKLFNVSIIGPKHYEFDDPLSYTRIIGEKRARSCIEIFGN